MAENIHSITHTLLPRTEKEMLLGQRARVFWLVGLSGSGKSTLARALEFQLHEHGFKTMLLDGDNLRTGLNQNLGFSEDDREENLRRTAEVAKLFASSGLVTLCSFISPTISARNIIASIIGPDDYKEVYINAPFEVCAQRDVKGLYAKAKAGEIKNFTGLDAPFEAPTDPFLEIHTDQQSEAASLGQLLDAVLPEITLP